jgi:hypothetical protein
MKQVDDWAEYFDTNKPQVRADLVRWAKAKDLLGYSDGDQPSNYSSDYLADPHTNLFESFHIFMGRRAGISEDEQRRKGQLSRRHNVEVATYDRFLDVIKSRYANVEHWLGSTS